MYQDLMDCYRSELIEYINQINTEQFQAFMEILLYAYREDRTIFLMGNGGSAATANHFVCDFGKNSVMGKKRRFRIFSLSESVEKITALGNDISFDDIFRQQLINLMRKGDVVIAVSASGNSDNLVHALEYARTKDGRIISLTGFNGGKIRELSDLCLVAQMQSYERIEDVHLIILHMAVCFFKEHQELLELCDAAGK